MGVIEDTGMSDRDKMEMMIEVSGIHSRKILNLLILNDNSSISQDEDWFDAVFRWPKSAINGIFMSFSKIFVSEK